MIDYMLLYNWILIPITIGTVILFLLTWKKVKWNGFLLLALGSIIYTMLRIYVTTIGMVSPDQIQTYFILVGEITRFIAAYIFYTTADKLFPSK